MVVLGIIAEYNPFHNGHMYHIDQSVKLIKPDYTIAVMSGHFTQRGEAAVIDKWERTEMALRSGIDLVIELPAAYSSQTAELFAFGGIQLLNHTGVVTHISFGSEAGDIRLLSSVARILSDEPTQFKSLLKEHLEKDYLFLRPDTGQLLNTHPVWGGTVFRKINGKRLSAAQIPYLHWSI